MGKATGDDSAEAPIRKSIDWERIEADYRAGVLSVREIAAARGVSHTAIQKRAKTGAWERDLRDRVMAAAQAKVSKALPEVAAAVATGNAVADALIVDAASTSVANILISHRSNIQRFRQLAIRMFEELEAMSAIPGELANLGDMLRKPDEFGADKLNDVYLKCISLPSRAKVLKDLGDVLKTLIALERQANNVDAKLDADPADEGVTREISETARRICFVLGKAINQQKGAS